jgi:hypothetical protein
MQETRVRFPPGYEFFWKIIAMLLDISDLLGIVCVLNKRNKAFAPKKLTMAEVCCFKSNYHNEGNTMVICK